MAGKGNVEAQRDVRNCCSNSDDAGMVTDLGDYRYRTAPCSVRSATPSSRSPLHVGGRLLGSPGRSRPGSAAPFKDSRLDTTPRRRTPARTGALPTMSMARAGGAIGKATGVIESMKTKTTAEATHTPMGITRTGRRPRGSWPRTWSRPQRVSNRHRVKSAKDKDDPLTCRCDLRVFLLSSFSLFV
jgi:hypothetical protein